MSTLVRVWNKKQRSYLSEHRRVCTEESVDGYVKDLEARLLLRPDHKHLMLERCRQLSVEIKEGDLRIVDIGDVSGFSDITAGSILAVVQHQDESVKEAR